MNRQEILAAMAWLFDLPQPPFPSARSPEAAAWAERLALELADVQATGVELLDACKAIARRPGQFFPSPGQVATEVKAQRLAAAERRREHEWKDRRTIDHDPTIIGQGPGWSNGRSLTADYDAVRDLVRRGHKGRAGGESYMAAVLREERERAEVEARGSRYQPRRYGPNLESGNLMRGPRV